VVSPSGDPRQIGEQVCGPGRRLIVHRIRDSNRRAVYLDAMQPIGARKAAVASKVHCHPTLVRVALPTTTGLSLSAPRKARFGGPHGRIDIVPGAEDNSLGRLSELTQGIDNSLDLGCVDKP